MPNPSAKLESILLALQPFGAILASRDDVACKPAPANGVLPPDFYSTTHLPTQVRLNGRWVEVQNTEMDLIIVVNPGRLRGAHDSLRLGPPGRARRRRT